MTNKIEQQIIEAIWLVDPELLIRARASRFEQWRKLSEAVNGIAIEIAPCNNWKNRIL